MSSSNGADFEHHWKRLHNKACEVIASPTDDTVNRMLGSLTALLFGLDESLKQKATGALHLIIQLVTSLNNSNNNNNTHDDDGDKKASQDTTDDRILDHDVVPVPVRSESITMAALKAIKSCVIRNPIGRNQCRAAGVFGFIQQTLIQYSQHIVVVEEAMTTLAAMSLSNDLNALQVS
jgi:hypothetical protein